MKIPYDKLQHFAAGVAITALIVAVTGSLALAGVAVVLVGAGRELYDACHPETNTADFWDFGATCMGWIPVAIAVQIY